MKKTKIILALLLAALLMLTLTACGSKDAKSTEATEDKAVATTDTVPVILDQAEYTLYQNVFYNGYGEQSVGQVTKRGVFTTIQDAFNEVTRYYVWGYLDNTLCCDWQWEFVPAEGAELPAVGSLVQVSGSFEKDDAALDGYWIKDAKVTVENAYTAGETELDMLTMGDTLERVQLMNIMYRKEAFEGKTFRAFGRISNIGLLEDPYYGNEAWQIPYQSDAEQPAIGAMVHLQGKVADGQLAECSIQVTE